MKVNRQSLPGVNRALWKSPCRSSTTAVTGISESRGLMSSAHSTNFVISLTGSVHQGGGARNRRQGPAVQRDPQEEEGEEGEEAAEEGRRLQPARTHVFHSQQ